MTVIPIQTPDDEPEALCSKCQDTGHSFGPRGYAPCNCPMGERFWRSASNMAGVPQAWDSVQLRDYEFQTPAQLEAHEVLTRWGRAGWHWRHAGRRTETPKGVLLHGVSRTGKSRLMAAAANSMIREGFSAEWVNLPEFYFAALQAQKDGSGVAALLDVSTSKDLIALDDIGAEKGSEFAQSLLYILLNRALERKIMVLATSNKSFAELADTMDPRNIGRLQELCQPVAIGRPKGGAA